MVLSKHTIELYKLSGKMNLYASLTCKNKNKLDVDRVKKEVNQIKLVIKDIENIIECIK